ncbi:hypothetical protein D3C72_1889930 [compost metagenome]
MLDGVLEDRFQAAGEGLAEMREKFGDYTEALERRLLMLFALRKGRLSLETMREEAVISKQAFNQIAQAIQQAWQANLLRPPLRGVQQGRQDGRRQGPGTQPGTQASGRVFGTRAGDGHHDADAEHDQAGNADIDGREAGR